MKSKSNSKDESFEVIQYEFVAEDCTVSRILEKKRQLTEVHDALEAQKDEFA